MFEKLVIKLFPMKEPFFGCMGMDVQDWLINSKKVYSLHNKGDNLCFWRTIALHKRYLKNGKKLYPRIEERSNTRGNRMCT